MASTVIGYFHNYKEAIQTLDDLIANEYNPEWIILAYQPPDYAAVVDYDNTLEQAPVIEFKQATFGADITEEDCIYYSKLLEQGNALLTVYVPSSPPDEPNWSDETAKTIEEFLAGGGAYDHEIRRIYGNRAGLTTYPQNRYLDPIGPNQINKDRIYESRSPLNGEVSNTIGVPDTSDYLEELEASSGRRVMTASEVMALRSRS
ncbi:MAG TPA: hypothetical protein VH186_25470 [Chloroflexia bacterium]|nr:hypothetical protein [Chloroflexia bacterium]